MSELLDTETVRVQIGELVGENQAYPSVTALAHDVGLCPEQLQMFLRGKRKNLEPKIAAAFGIEKVVFYRAANKGACIKDQGGA